MGVLLSTEMIQARINRIGEHFLLQFRDSLAQSENWSFSITFQHLLIHEEPYFLPLDIDYEEEEIQPPSSIEQMVHDIIRVRWPVPFPHHLMATTAKDAWDQVQ